MNKTNNFDSIISSTSYSEKNYYNDQPIENLEQNFESINVNHTPLKLQYTNSNSENLEPNISKLEIINYIPNEELKLACFNLFLYGFTGTFSWNIIINSIYAIFTTIFNFPEGADSILIGYFVFAMITGIWRVKYRTIAPNLFKMSLLLLLISSIVIPLISYFFDDQKGIILIYVFCALIGTGSSVIISSGLAYSAIAPINLTKFIYTGNGFAGLLGFALWQFLTRLFYNAESIEEIRIAHIWMHVIHIITIIICYFFLNNMLKKSWFKISYKNFVSTNKIKLSNQDFSEYLKLKKLGKNPQLVGSRSPIALMKAAFYPLLFGNGAFFVTFSLFPNFGPYAWHGLDLNTISLLVGTYQVFDSFGRFLPVFIKVVRIKFKAIVILSLIRFIFYPIFLIFFFIDNPVTTNFSFQLIIIILLGFSHGYVSSLALSSVPTYVHNLTERGIVGICSNLHWQFFLALSFIFSTILKALLNF